MQASAIINVAMRPSLCKALLAVLALGAATLARAQDGDAPAVELRSDLTELRVVVTDKGGRRVTGLSRDDFEVSEDGAAREVAFFAATDDMAGDGGARRSVDVSGPVLTRALAPPTRTIALVVDTLHASPASFART